MATARAQRRGICSENTKVTESRSFASLRMAGWTLSTNSCWDLAFADWTALWLWPWNCAEIGSGPRSTL